MAIPPVFAVEQIQPSVIEDIRDASNIYCSKYSYTMAFDALFLDPVRRHVVTGFLDGSVAPSLFADRLREWLLKPWSSVRSLPTSRMTAIGDALGRIQPAIASFVDRKLEDVDHAALASMVAIFHQLDECAGVGPTVASKLLAPLSPALFPMWDNPIASAYGFALNAAGYHQYLRVTQSVARRVRSYWTSMTSLEEHLKPACRQWKAPLTKVIDEWNWIRITRGHQY